MILEHEDKGAGNTAGPRSAKNKQSCPAQVLLSQPQSYKKMLVTVASSGVYSFVVLAHAPCFSSTQDFFLSQIFAQQ